MVSVIICHHVGDFIYDCVKSVKLSYGVFCEIIIMTSDPALHIPNCRIIHSIKSPSEKRNEAARLAEGKYLVFLDDDVTISSDCIYNLRSSCENYGMVFSKLLNMQYRDRLDDAGSFLTKTGFLWSRAGQLDQDNGQYDEPCYVLAGKSACCIIRKKLFYDLGGFDEDFQILAEETDLAWRAWLIGEWVYYNPKATGRHAFNTNLKPKNKHYTTERVNYNGCRNYIVMLIKNLEARNLWRILPIHVLIWSFVGLAMLIIGKFRQGWAVLRGIGYVIRNWKTIITKRSKIQKGRMISDQELFSIWMRKTPKGYYVNRGIRYLRIGLHG